MASPSWRVTKGGVRTRGEGVGDAKGVRRDAERMARSRRQGGPGVTPPGGNPSKPSDLETMPKITAPPRERAAKASTVTMPGKQRTSSPSPTSSGSAPRQRAQPGTEIVTTPYGGTRVVSSGKKPISGALYETNPGSTKKSSPGAIKGPAASAAKGRKPGTLYEGRGDAITGTTVKQQVAATKKTTTKTTPKLPVKKSNKNPYRL